MLNPQLVFSIEEEWTKRITFQFGVMESLIFVVTLTVLIFAIYTLGKKEGYNLAAAKYELLINELEEKKP